MVAYHLSLSAPVQSRDLSENNGGVVISIRVCLIRLKDKYDMLCITHHHSGISGTCIIKPAL